VRVAFPVRARVTYPDTRIDAVRGTFAVERGPLVLALGHPTCRRSGASASSPRTRTASRPTRPAPRSPCTGPPPRLPSGRTTPGRTGAKSSACEPG